eukprot:768061-Amphidinium_carterae.1
MLKKTSKAHGSDRAKHEDLLNRGSGTLQWAVLKVEPVSKDISSEHAGRDPKKKNLDDICTDDLLLQRFWRSGPQTKR